MRARCWCRANDAAADMKRWPLDILLRGRSDRPKSDARWLVNTWKCRAACLFVHNLDFAVCVATGPPDDDMDLRVWCGGQVTWSKVSAEEFHNYADFAAKKQTNSQKLDLNSSRKLINICNGSVIISMHIFPNINPHSIHPFSFTFNFPWYISYDGHTTRGRN